MKKNWIFALLFIVLSACIKEEMVPTLPITKYTIEASAGPNGTISPSGKIEVVSGENLNFTLKPDVGFKEDSITVNGINLPLTGTTYSLKNITSDYKIKGTFKKTLSWYLMLKPWVEDSIIIRELNGTWSHYASTDKDSVTFIPNGRFSIYRKGVLVGDGPWSINETTNPPTLNFGGGPVWELERLDEVSLITVKDDVKEIYSHH